MLLQQREHLHLSKTPPESEVTNTKVFSFRSRQTTALENNTKAIQGKSIETIPRSHRKSTASSFLFVARLGIRLKAGLQLWKLSSAQVALFFLQRRELLERAGPILVSKIQPHTAQTPHPRHPDLQPGARFPPADRKLPTALPSPLGTGKEPVGNWDFAGEYGQAARIRNSGTQNHKTCGTSETLPAASSGSRRPAPTLRPRAGTSPRTRLSSHTSMDQRRSQRCRGLSW